MKNSNIHPSAILGVPLRQLQCGLTSDIGDQQMQPIFGKDVFIGPNAVIGFGCILEDRVVVDGFCSLDPNVHLKADVMLIYRAAIGGNSVIGCGSIIGGFIPENCQVGERCRIFGDLVHSHADSTISWDHHEVPEISPQIHDDSFIGFRAVIAGNVSIGPRAYVCAGAIVTRDVPPRHIAHGINQVVHYTQWKGILRENPLFNFSGEQ